VAGLGAPELLIILAVVLLLFGSAKVPQLARSLGQAKRELQAGQDDPTPGRPEDRTTPTS
jgi:sec-independent protein translocase protein TatA